MAPVHLQPVFGSTHLVYTSSPEIRAMAGRAASTSGTPPVHRACDECRLRKLACSKEAHGCSRCRREGISCYYSPQKRMGRPRKYRPTDNDSFSQRASPAMNHSGGVSSSTQSMVPDTHSFQISNTSAPSFSDQPLALLDHQANTPHDLALLDFLPDSYQDEGGIPISLTSASAPLSHSECLSIEQNFDGALSSSFSMPHDTMDAYADMSFLDPAFVTTGLQNDGYDVYGNTPDLSAGSHTPYSSESSYSPSPSIIGLPSRQSISRPDHHRQPHVSPAVGAAASYSEPALPLPTFSCQCISSLYRALESLSNLPSDIPAALRVARRATKVAHSVVDCKACSSGLFDLAQPPPMQVFQNTMLLATLIPSVCNAYTAVLEMINRACRLATQQRRTMHFSLREVGESWGSSASGAGAEKTAILLPDVHKFDNRYLEPSTWRRLILSIIRLDVYGNRNAKQTTGCCLLSLIPPASSHPHLGLSDIVTVLDECSSKRHELLDAAAALGLAPTHHGTQYMTTPRACQPEKKNYVQALEVARLALNNLVIA